MKRRRSRGFSKLVPTEVLYATAKQRKPLVVEGFHETTCEGLAIHQSLERNRHGKHPWVVTHAPTGMSIGTMGSKANAIRALRDLCRTSQEAGIDWTVPKEKLAVREVYDLVVMWRGRHGGTR